MGSQHLAWDLSMHKGSWVMGHPYHAISCPCWPKHGYLGATHVGAWHHGAPTKLQSDGECDDRPIVFGGFPLNFQTSPGHNKYPKHFKTTTFPHFTHVPHQHQTPESSRRPFLFRASAATWAWHATMTTVQTA